MGIITSRSDDHFIKMVGHNNQYWSEFSIFNSSPTFSNRGIGVVVIGLDKQLFLYR